MDTSNKISTIKVFLKTKLGLTVLGVAGVVVITTGYFITRGGGKTPLEIYTVKRGPIVQEVSVTGKVRSAGGVSLSFVRSGQVVRVYKDEGDKVKSGEALIELDRSDLDSQLLENQASVAAQRAKLDELKRGSRPEDIQAAETDVKKAEQDLINDYANVLTIMNDAYAKAYDAVRKQADDLFTNDEETDPLLTFQTKGSQIERDVKSLRATASIELNTWRDELKALAVKASDADLEAALQKSYEHLLVIRKFENTALDAVNDALNLTSTNATAYKASLNTGIAAINTAIASVSSQIQIIAAQKISVQKSKDQLALKVAGSTAESIAAQEAVLKQAEAKLQSTQTEIEKTILRSPINGVVTEQLAKVGEIAGTNAKVVSLISDAALEINANIPEADVAKVAVGNKANITLDAYGPEKIFKGKVIKINPGETIIDGVATYATTIEFASSTAEARSGMTANVDIRTAERENVLLVPQRLIATRDGKRVVFMSTGNDTPEEREIAVGLRGSDGNVEVLSGLTEGELLVTPVRE